MTTTPVSIGPHLTVACSSYEVASVTSAEGVSNGRARRSVTQSSERDYCCLLAGRWGPPRVLDMSIVMQELRLNYRAEVNAVAVSRRGRKDYLGESFAFRSFGKS